MSGILRDSLALDELSPKDLPYYMEGLTLTKIDGASVYSPMIYLSCLLRDNKMLSIMQNNVYSRFDNPVDARIRFESMVEAFISFQLVTMHFMTDAFTRDSKDPNIKDGEKEYVLESQHGEADDTFDEEYYNKYVEQLENENGIYHGLDLDSVYLKEFAINVSKLLMNGQRLSAWVLIGALSQIEGFRNTFAEFTKDTLDMTPSELMALVKMGEENFYNGSIFDITNEEYQCIVAFLRHIYKLNRQDEINTRFRVEETSSTLEFYLADTKVDVLPKEKFIRYYNQTAATITGMSLISSDFCTQLVEQMQKSVFPILDRGDKITFHTYAMTFRYPFKIQQDPAETGEVIPERMYQFNSTELAIMLGLSGIPQEQQEYYLIKLMQGSYDTRNESIEDWKSRVENKYNDVDTVKPETKERISNDKNSAPEVETQRTMKFGDLVITDKELDLLAHINNDSWRNYSRRISLMLQQEIKNSILFIGPEGVGKTSFLKHEAWERNLGRYSDSLTKDGAQIQFAFFNLADLASAMPPGGQLEAYIQQTLSNIASRDTKANTKTVIICDDFGDIVARTPYASSSAVFFTQQCSKLNIPLIAASSTEGFSQNLLGEPIIERFFDRVDFKEPSKEIPVGAENSELSNTIYNRVASLEQSSGIEVSREIINETIMLADKFIRGKAFPEKALTLIDKAVAQTRLELLEKKPSTVRNYDARKNTRRTKKPIAELTSEALYKVIEEEYNIPSIQLSSSQWDNIKHLEEQLKSRVIGQDEAISKFISQWKLYQAGLVEDNKPIGSFLFIGPTGVGKTELSKRIAEFTNRELIRFDMSEFSEEYKVSNLIGSAKGYVGYQEGGLLTQKICQNPNSVLLLDEIEKAHPSVHDLLLQIMDNAVLTGNHGETADFRNTIIIMTSNCGARDAQNVKALGFNATPDRSSTYQAELSRTFKPEFLGRLNAIVTFNELSQETCDKIRDLQLRDLEEQVIRSYKGIDHIDFDDSLANKLTANIDVKSTGARGIRNEIASFVKTELAEFLLKNFAELRKGNKTLRVAYEPTTGSLSVTQSDTTDSTETKAK